MDALGRLAKALDEQKDHHLKFPQNLDVSFRFETRTYIPIHERLQDFTTVNPITGQKENPLAASHWLQTLFKIAAHNNLQEHLSANPEEQTCLSAANLALFRSVIARPVAPLPPNPNPDEVSLQNTQLTSLAQARSSIAADNHEVARRNTAMGRLLNGFIRVSIGSTVLRGLEAAWAGGGDSECHTQVQDTIKLVTALNKGNYGDKSMALKALADEIPVMQTPMEVMAGLAKILKLKALEKHYLTKEVIQAGAKLGEDDDGNDIIGDLRLNVPVNTDFPAQPDQQLIMIFLRKISLSVKVKDLRDKVQRATVEKWSLAKLDRILAKLMAEYIPPDQVHTTVRANSAVATESQPLMQAAAYAPDHPSMALHYGFPPSLPDPAQGIVHYGYGSDNPMPMYEMPDQRYCDESIEHTGPDHQLHPHVYAARMQQQAKRPYPPVHHDQQTRPRLSYGGAAAAASDHGIYGHSASNPSPPPPSQLVCPHFKRNQCRFGDHCSYSHDLTGYTPVHMTQQELAMHNYHQAAEESQQANAQHQHARGTSGPMQPTGVFQQRQPPPPPPAGRGFNSFRSGRN